MDIKQAFSQMEDLSRSKKLVILLVTIAVIGGLYWYFIYQPATERIKEVKNDIESLNQQIAKYEKQVKKLPQLRARLDEKKEILVRARELLPESKHAVEKLLAEIEKLGQEENVEFLSFNPGGVNKHDLYATRSLSIEVKAPFHNLMHFFSRISSLDTLITIESLDMSPVNQESAGEVTVSSSTRLLVYRALDEKK
ncbi:MAG: type 4a pilus biogenesis protein PilO [Desulfohalobiaceae bacterium]|nr:type 4a pilus biogenesis protein PilO [Desulfohalobiaceae bacterium]